MNMKTFKASIEKDTPPEGITPALQALWRQAKGDWHEAHRLAQTQTDETGAWVHAYLHRVEGDETNANHWYLRAGKPNSSAPLNEEWEEIASALLSHGR
jgi:hypothetical protein